MKRYQRGLRNYLLKAEMAQRVVLGWSASPALGLKLLGRPYYEKVAVDGVRAKETLKELEMDDLGKILSTVAEGSDTQASLSSSLSLISRLLEADVYSRERWIYLTLTLGMALTIGIALLLTFSGLHIPPYYFALLFLLYPFIPGLNPESLDVDPGEADAMASYLEGGGGRVYSLKALGLYEMVVLDESLSQIELPTWAKVIKELSNRNELSEVIRKTSDMLKEFKKIHSMWKAKIRSLRAINTVITAALGLTNAFLLRFVNSPLIGSTIPVPPDLAYSLIISGVLISLISSKPVGISLYAASSYLTAFSIAYLLIPQ